MTSNSGFSFKTYAPLSGALLATGHKAHHAHAMALSAVRMEMARAVPDYDGMDDTSEFGVTHHAQDSMTSDLFDDKLRALTAGMNAIALDDVKHEMREAWRCAVDNHNALSTPMLPFVTNGLLCKVSVRVLIGELMDTHWATELLTDALRTGNTIPLHTHLRTMWIDANAQQLLALGWER